jgi:hypothetical protein
MQEENNIGKIRKPCGTNYKGSIKITWHTTSCMPQNVVSHSSQATRKRPPQTIWRAIAKR